MSCCVFKIRAQKHSSNSTNFKNIFSIYPSSKKVNAHQNIADMLTKATFTSDQWIHLCRLAQLQPSLRRTNTNQVPQALGEPGQMVGKAAGAFCAQTSNRCTKSRGTHYGNQGVNYQDPERSDTVCHTRQSNNNNLRTFSTAVAQASFERPRFAQSSLEFPRSPPASTTPTLVVSNMSGKGGAAA